MGSPFSPRPPSAVCIGHSHVRSLARAAADRGVPLAVIDFWATPPFDSGEEGVRLSAAIRAQLSTGPVLSMIGGDVHHTLGLVVHPRPFDFILPEMPDLPLDADAEIVPFDGVRAAMLEGVKNHFALMTHVRKVVTGPVFHFEPPPVPCDDARLEIDVPWMFFHGRRRVAPAMLRYKLWRLHSAVLAEFCADVGITFVPAPIEAMRPDGFLAPHLYQDAMHVTPAYGTLLLAQIDRLAPAVSAAQAASANVASS